MKDTCDANGWMVVVMISGRIMRYGRTRSTTFVEYCTDFGFAFPYTEELHFSQLTLQ